MLASIEGYKKTSNILKRAGNLMIKEIGTDSTIPETD
jgi:hypothetical protein